MTKTTRSSKRALMLYVPSEVYDAIRKLGEEQKILVKPGPMAAYILKSYFEKETSLGKRSANTSA